MLNKMKYKFIIVLVASLLLSVSITIAYAVINRKPTSLFRQNIEALTQYEGPVITCSAGSWGQCFVKESAWPFGKCVWTGYQSDYCDLSGLY